MAFPDHLDVQRRFVTSRGEVNYDTSTVTPANAYSSLGIDNSWDEEDWKASFQVVLNWMKGNDMEFDLINTDPAIVNALRRIIIAEVPIMALEHIFFINNTSIIADEVLAHRLGLIPLNADPDIFDFKKREETANEKNTLVFKLKVHCKRNGSKVENDKVFSSAFQWLPQGSNMPDETNCRFATGQEGLLETPAKPVHDDILLAKLRPGQCIDLEAHATKGIGAEHAKWSPVATAWYRLHPEVVLMEKVTGEDAQQLVSLCPGLFILKERTGEQEAKVTAARGNEKQLEKLRHLVSEEKWKKRIQLRKCKTHFIFTIESVGVQPPDLLFTKALDALSAKCDNLLARL